MKEVYEFLKKAGTYYLATLDGNKPKVRPFGTIDVFDSNLTIQTGKVKDVSKQIHTNPSIEICAFLEGKWIRLEAEAIEETRIEAQEHMLNEYPSLKNMYKAGDGNTEIFKLVNCKATIYSFEEAPKVYKW